MQDLENKIRAALADQFGLSDEWQDGTYLYHLTRVKSAFDIGAMTLDDFEEVDEEFLEESIQAVMDIIHEVLTPKYNLINLLSQITDKNRHDEV